MSLEEKAKYTMRAREVWDNYLSTAPTRTPKPRKQVPIIFLVTVVYLFIGLGESYSFDNAG